MKDQDELYELIKSLSKSEKRYFKLFASGYSGTKNHIRLFEAIEKQTKTDIGDCYNEKAIKQGFKGEAFIRQLHVTKNYLKNLILKSLRNYHQHISIGSILKDQLRDIEILYNKGLYKQSKKLIKKSEQLALEHEKFTILIELMSWKRNILQVEKGPYQSVHYNKEIVKSERSVIKSLENIIDYWDLGLKILEDNFNNNPAKTSYNNNPLLKNERRAISFPAKKMYHFIRYTQSVFNSETKNGYDHALAAIRLFEKHPQQIKEDPISYATAINNLIPICFRLGKYDEVKDLIEKVKKLPQNYALSNFDHLYFKLFLRTYNNELELYRDLGEIESGIKLIGEVKEFLQRFDGVITQDYRTLFNFQIAYFYFADSNYSQSLEYLNKILNEKETERTDIYTYTRILNLMVHYELKNYDLIEYLYQSTKRYLNKKNRLYNFEKAILEFFKNVSQTNNENAISKLKNLKKKILALDEDHSESLDYINILVWIQSKLNRRPFIKLIQEYQKNQPVSV